MNAKAAGFLLGCLVGCGVLAAELPPVEQSVESMTDATSVPTALGAIAVRACPGCPAQYLTLTSQSKFFVGETEVAFAEFHKTAALPRPRGLVVHYRAEDKTITRVVLSPGND